MRQRLLSHEQSQSGKQQPRKQLAPTLLFAVTQFLFLELVNRGVNGSQIRVELNGTVIVDGDVSKVTEFMANSPHPGKDRTSGYFGLAGHNDPVSFRSVLIKPL